MTEQNEKPAAPAEDAPKAATPKAAPKQAKSDEPKFSVERVIDEAYLITGYPSHVLAGALADKTGNLTASQATAAAEKFLNREVQEG